MSSLFTNTDGTAKTGAIPSHLHEEATGLFYVFAAFDDATGDTTTLLAARTDALGNALTWADGTTQKTIVAGTPAAGRPVVVVNAYDPERPLLLRHGDRKFSGTQGGELWTEIT